MEITRRTSPFFVGVLHCFMLLLPAAPFAADAKDVLLSIRHSGKDFKDAFTGFQDELNDDFEVKELVIDKKCTVEEIGRLIRLEKPKLLLLMDNTVITLFRKYQSTLSESDPVIPSISIMGIMINDATGNLKNATGISYEIPVVTSVVNLRTVLSLPLKRIGIVHREYLDDFIKQNIIFCKRENIDLITVSLPNKNTSYKTSLKKALTRLSSDKIDAVWIPNDNALLQPDIIRTIWIPQLRKMKIPVMVGIEVLVNPKLNFGTFAVLPDHISLGNQAAGMVYDIMDNNWQCGENHIEPPLAVFKIINVPQATKLFDLADDKLHAVDKKLK